MTTRWVPVEMALHTASHPCTTRLATSLLAIAVINGIGVVMGVVGIVVTHELVGFRVTDGITQQMRGNS